jgi:hypothetical protein
MITNNELRKLLAEAARGLILPPGQCMILAARLDRLNELEQLVDTAELAIKGAAAVHARLERLEAELVTARKENSALSIEVTLYKYPFDGRVTMTREEAAALDAQIAKDKERLDKLERVAKAGRGAPDRCSCIRSGPAYCAECVEIREAYAALDTGGNHG